jgi:hypothetical protein
MTAIRRHKLARLIRQLDEAEARLDTDPTLGLHIEYLVAGLKLRNFLKRRKLTHNKQN